jgi:hypothetical protein
VLGDWGLLAVVEDAEVIVSELFTNALQASVGDASMIGLRLSADHDHLLIMVWDSSAQMPAVRYASPADVDGRGTERRMRHCHWCQWRQDRLGEDAPSQVMVARQVPQPGWNEVGLRLPAVSQQSHRGIPGWRHLSRLQRAGRTLRSGNASGREATATPVPARTARGLRSGKLRWVIVTAAGGW